MAKKTEGSEQQVAAIRKAPSEEEVQYLSGFIIRAHALDPRTAPGQARTAAEFICKFVYTREVGQLAKDYTFDKIIGELCRRKIVPPRICVPLRTVQAYGNFGGHAQSDLKELGAAPCLAALAQVTSWYFEDYLGDEIPERLVPMQTLPPSKPARNPALFAAIGILVLGGAVGLTYTLAQPGGVDKLSEAPTPAKEREGKSVDSKTEEKVEPKTTRVVAIPAQTAEPAASARFPPIVIATATATAKPIASAVPAVLLKTPIKVAASATTKASVVPAATTPSHTASCSPPFFLDDKGRKVAKPECETPPRTASCTPPFIFDDKGRKVAKPECE